MWCCRHSKSTGSRAKAQVVRLQRKGVRLGKDDRSVARNEHDRAGTGRTADFEVERDVCKGSGNLGRARIASSASLKIAGLV